MKMKFFLSILFALLFQTGSCQAPKKPSLIILPSDNWCTERYFIQKIDNQGTMTDMVDYERAFKEDVELPMVISTVGGFLAEKGYAVKDAEQASKNLRTAIAENNATMSKSGVSLAENTLDVIKNRVKADILVQVSWTYLGSGSNQTTQYTIETFDCYSGFRIPATITGFGKGSKSSIVSVLEKGIPSKLGDFDKKLQAYFDGLAANGREISIDVRRWTDWENDFDTEYDGEPLTDIIEKWVADNSVNASYNMTESDENIAKFEQVHIPVFNDRGTAMDARNFASKFRVFLKNKLNIPAKVISGGLGKVVIILGDNN